MNKMPCADFHIKKKLIVILTIQQLCQEKISVDRLFKHHRGALIVDALLQQFMFKGFDFYIVIWKKPKFRLPRLKYEKLYSQANQKPPTFYIYIEIYIWRIINVWWVIITHLNWISFSEHLFFFVPVSQSVLSIDTCPSVHLLILLSLIYFKF